MNCPKCTTEMREGIVIVETFQSVLLTIARFTTKTIGGLVWINCKLDDVIPFWNLEKSSSCQRVRLAPVALKKEDRKKAFICEGCGISVIEYK
jgi:hypothetical protein